MFFTLNCNDIELESNTEHVVPYLICLSSIIDFIIKNGKLQNLWAQAPRVSGLILLGQICEVLKFRSVWAGLALLPKAFLWKILKIPSDSQKENSWADPRPNPQSHSSFITLLRPTNGPNWRAISNLFPVRPHLYLTIASFRSICFSWILLKNSNPSSPKMIPLSSRNSSSSWNRLSDP